MRLKPLSADDSASTPSRPIHLPEFVTLTATQWHIFGKEPVTTVNITD